jgi:UDPglucose 6-dehydrogenase
MKITVVGTGYVGLVTGAILSDRGNEVTCVDINKKIIDNLNDGKIHIFEPGLKEIVSKNVSNGNLSFTTNLDGCVKDSQVIFLAVGTPSGEDGSFNLKYLKSAACDIGKAIKGLDGFRVVVCKSTVPQGTYLEVEKVINRELSGTERWAYVSNPEFLAEGSAVRDFSKPNRIVIGSNNFDAIEVMKELYHPFNIQRDRIFSGSCSDAELTKLFSNTALANRIAMVNEFARIADSTPGADMDNIRRMVCEDKRIGYSFMFPSPGYGGSCFPKDVQGLVAKSLDFGFSPLLVSQIHESNEAHKIYLAKKVSSIVDCENATVGVWGLTFKPNTDDMRDSASIPIITHLLNKGVKVKVYDPKDVKAREIFGERVEFCSDKYDVANGSDALVLLTEWREFDTPDFNKLYDEMKGNVVFDFRNRWLCKAANRAGLSYYGVGRNYPLKN